MTKEQKSHSAGMSLSRRILYPMKLFSHTIAFLSCVRDEQYVYVGELLVLIVQLLQQQNEELVSVWLGLLREERKLFNKHPSRG